MKHSGYKRKTLHAACKQQMHKIQTLSQNHLLLRTIKSMRGKSRSLFCSSSEVEMLIKPEEDEFIATTGWGNVLMRISSKTARIDQICKNVDFSISAMVYLHICLQPETYWPRKEFRDDQPTIEQRVKITYTLMNNSNFNSASTACSTILELLHYAERQ